MKGSNMLNLNKKIIWVVVLCWGSLILAGNAFAAESRESLILADARDKTLRGEFATSTTAAWKTKRNAIKYARNSKFGLYNEGVSGLVNAYFDVRPIGGFGYIDPIEGGLIFGDPPDGDDGSGYNEMNGEGEMGNLGGDTPFSDGLGGDPFGSMPHGSDLGDGVISDGLGGTGGSTLPSGGIINSNPIGGPGGKSRFSRLYGQYDDRDDNFFEYDNDYDLSDSYGIDEIGGDEGGDVDDFDSPGNDGDDATGSGEDEGKDDGKFGLGG